MNMTHAREFFHSNVNSISDSMPANRSSYKWVARSNALSIKIANDKYLPTSSGNPISSSIWKPVTQRLVSKSGQRDDTVTIDNSAFATNANIFRANSNRGTGNVTIRNDSNCDSGSKSSFSSKFSLRNGEAKDSYIRYDPYSHKLMKTIAVRPVAARFDGSFDEMPAETTRNSKFHPSSPYPRTNHRSKLDSCIKSRFKLIRNASSERPAPSRSDGNDGTFERKKIDRPRDRVVTKSISKYKIRRRSFSSSSVSRKQIRVNWMPVYRRRNTRFSSTLNSYKVAKRVPNFFNGNMYKIDRRTRMLNVSEANKLRSRTLQRVLKQNSKQFSKINHAKAKANGKTASTKHCLFYIRYGRCSRGSSCPFTHDPEKIVVCTRFLRGTCKIKDCLFSHVVSPDKMPLCRFFLFGKCNRSNCPYLHVKHAVGASNCKDFESGFCPKGAKCDKKHESGTRKNRKASPKNVCKHTVSLDEAVGKTRERKLADANEKSRKVLSLKIKSTKKQETDGDELSGPLPEFIPLVKASSK